MVTGSVSAIQVSAQLGPLGVIGNLHEIHFHKTYTLSRFLFFLLKYVHVYGNLKPRRTTTPKLVPLRETKKPTHK